MDNHANLEIRYSCFDIIRFLFVGEILAQPDNIETFLKIQMQNKGIPGLQVTVAQKEKIVFSGAYGIVNIKDSIPVTHKNVFPGHSIQSIKTCYGETLRSLRSSIKIYQIHLKCLFSLYNSLKSWYRWFEFLPATPTPSIEAGFPA